ncbi:MAG: hypothetical protein ABSG97_09960 [Sedimentisphaerales bacterium]|jgi:hypothetical protein
MTIKSLSLVVAIISGFFVFLVSAKAVDTLAIEAVRGKSVLDDADLKTIDDFVAKAVGDLLATQDFSSISNARAVIVANSVSSQQNQTQFAEQFSKSAQKYISAGLQQAEGMTPADRSFRIVTNLLMLADALADVRVAEAALKYVDSKNEGIRYWAVHCLTNPGITEKLNSPKAIDTARQVVRRLDEIVATSSPDTLGLIASFAGSIKISEGEALLLKVADRRITSYADWSVERELLDGDILRILGDKMASSSASKESVGRRFGQLFSYVLQRYIRSADVLTDTQKEQLASVLVETEKTSLSKILGKPRYGIKKAIESGDINALQQEYNNLFGDGTKAGELNIDYGKDAGGAPITHPLLLASPSAASK